MKRKVRKQEVLDDLYTPGLFYKVEADPNDTGDGRTRRRSVAAGLRRASNCVASAAVMRGGNKKDEAVAKKAPSKSAPKSPVPSKSAPKSATPKALKQKRQQIGKRQQQMGDALPHGASPQGPSPRGPSPRGVGGGLEMVVPRGNRCQI